MRGQSSRLLERGSVRGPRLDDGCWGEEGAGSSAPGEGLASTERQDSSDGEVPKAPRPLRCAVAQQAEISAWKRGHRERPLSPGA